MSSTTENLKLVKPEESEFYDVAVANKNMDLIDIAVKGAMDALNAYMESNNQSVSDIKNGNTKVSKATTADALSSGAGSATNPCYVDSDGKPQACSFKLLKDVPSDADFSKTEIVDNLNSTDGTKALSAKQGNELSKKNDDCVKKITEHLNNKTSHITQLERTSWNKAYTDLISSVPLAIGYSEDDNCFVIGTETLRSGIVYHVLLSNVPTISKSEYELEDDNGDVKWKVNFGTISSGVNFIKNKVYNAIFSGNTLYVSLDSESAIENCLKSVSDGKKTVASAITAQGVNTAADAEFATMAENIGTVGANKYNSGRTQGRNDVTGAPNSYGLYTGDQYNANYNSGYSNGASASASNACVFAAVTNGGSGSNVAYDKSLFSVSGNTVVCRRSGNFQILKGGYCDMGSCSVKKTSNGSTSYALGDGVAIGTCWMNAGDYFTVTCDAYGGNCSFVCIFAV